MTTLTDGSLKYLDGEARRQGEKDHMYPTDLTAYINAHNAAVSDDIRRARIGGRKPSDRAGSADWVSRALSRLLNTQSSATRVTTTSSPNG
ncbi:MAG: hypothetical protein ABFR53_01425 [Actinomycetota bacterium]